jgi:hypothetical protein
MAAPGTFDQEGRGSSVVRECWCAAPGQRGSALAHTGRSEIAGAERHRVPVRLGGGSAAAGPCLACVRAGDDVAGVLDRV